METEAEILKYC